MIWDDTQCQIEKYSASKIDGHTLYQYPMANIQKQSIADNLNYFKYQWPISHTQDQYQYLYPISNGRYPMEKYGEQTNIDTFDGRYPI